MSRVVTLDLDEAADVEKLWNEVYAIRRHRDADPELLRALEALVEKMPTHVAAEVRSALDCAAPAVVLAEYQGAFFEAKFGPAPIRTVGTYLCEDESRYREDPPLLANYVRELARVILDRKYLVEAAVAYARRCGIADDIFKPIILAAVREALGVARVD